MRELWWDQADASAAQMDLVLELFESPDEVAGNLEYATDLFTRSTMDRMAGHLQVGSLRHASALVQHFRSPHVLTRVQ